MLNARVKLRHLMAFQEVARLNSMARAAQTLSITQPAMSKTIRELEEIVGATLFERSPSGVTLTAAGATLLRHAGPALRSLDAGFRAVHQTSAQAVVRLGALSSVEQGLLPRALVRLAQTLPGVRVQVTTGSSAYLLSRLGLGELEMVVGRMSEAREIRGLHFEPLYHEPLVLVARAGHALAAGDADAAALAAAAWVIPPAATTLREQVERFWVEQGGWCPPIALETLSLSLSRRYVLATDAVWVAPLDAVREDLASGVLMRLPVALEAHGGALGLCTNLSLPLSAGAERLQACLREIAAEVNGADVDEA
ncbi:pca operon transcription factor PcaQ [Salinicola sp. DM10]|uniref:pca operon transcription factor PcaQ n=1 Tax=Salinicola sp. DM10 TaxID=2815721 RepID=UPI001A904FFA|nr:pca operon transcription factor PcaQ [Salinicola sp. DM10]MCE3028465.1 pca operon transcription factor PcaQ [Salinicola sp. DM10]